MAKRVSKPKTDKDRILEMLKHKKTKGVLFSDFLGNGLEEYQTRKSELKKDGYKFSKAWVPRSEEYCYWLKQYVPKKTSLHVVRA